MKKRFYIVCLILMLTLSALLYAGCFEKVEVSFVQLDIGKRQTDYFFDFVIKIDNNTDRPETITPYDFYIEINEKEIDNVGFMYANKDVYYAAHVTIESNDTLTLRVRAISAINDKERNKVVVKYKDQVIAEDSLLITDTNK